MYSSLKDNESNHSLKCFSNGGFFCLTAENAKMECITLPLHRDWTGLMWQISSINGRNGTFAKEIGFFKY